jgi:hypothetical protein
VLQITIQPNPVKVEKYSFTSSYGVSLQDIYNQSNIKVPIQQCIFVVNDTITQDYSTVPEDNSIITVKALLAGDGNGSGVVGVVSFASGAIAALGLGLTLGIGGWALAGLALIGGIVGLLSSDASPETKQNYSFDGKPNEKEQYEIVPVLYGTTKYSPSYGGNDFTEYIDEECYLHQLYVVGYKPTYIDTLNIGDVRIAYRTYETRSLVISASAGTITATGAFTDFSVGDRILLHDGDNKGEHIVTGTVTGATVNILICSGSTFSDETDSIRYSYLVYDTENNYSPNIQIVDDGVFDFTNSYYPYQISESSINKVCEYDQTQYYTTSANVNKVDLEFAFLSGVYNINNMNKKRSVTFVVYAKKTTDTGWVFIEQYTKTGNTREAWWFTEELFLGTKFSEIRGKYDIKIVRRTSTEKRYVDTLTLVTMRTYQVEDDGTNSPPIQEETASGLTCLLLKVKATDEISGSINNLNIVATRWVDDYTGSDPDTDDSADWELQESHNPASMFLDVIQNSALARHPEADSLIDWPSLQNWHEWCDTQEYTCDGILLKETTVKEELQKICATGRAEFGIIDGKYTINQMTERPTAVQMFTARNIVKGTFAVTRSFDTVPDGIAVQFVNAPNGYILDERQINDDYTTNMTVSFDYVNNMKQASELGQVILNAARLQIIQYQFGASLDALVATRGDKILLQHDGALYGKTSGRVKAITESGGNLVSIQTDEECTFEVGVSYGVTVRGIDSATGDSVFETFTLRDMTEETTTTLLTLDPAEPHNIAVGDLFSFGERTSETVPCLVTDVQYDARGHATVNAVEYNENVYDTATGDEWESRITGIGSARNVVNTATRGNIDRTLSEIVEKQNDTPVVHIFQNEPTPPYNEGDIWFDGAHTYDAVDYKLTDESFSLSDWRLRASSTFDVLNKDTFNTPNPEHRWKQIPGDALPYNLLTATDYDVTSGDGTKDELLINDDTDWEPTGTLEAVTVEADALTHVNTVGDFTSVYAVGRYEENGYMGESYTNLIVSPDAPVTQDVVIDAGDYVLQCYRGTITCTYGEASYGVPLEFTSTGETLTLTITDCKYGSLTKTDFIPPYVNGSFVATYDSFILTGTTLYISTKIVNIPTTDTYNICHIYGDADNYIKLYMTDSLLYIDIKDTGVQYTDSVSIAEGNYEFTIDWTTGVIIQINSTVRTYTEVGDIYGFGEDGDMYGFGTDVYGYDDSDISLTLTSADVGEDFNNTVLEVEYE